MARGKQQQQRLRLLGRILVVTSLASLSQVQASVFGRNEFYNAINALQIRGVATPQEPALLPGFYPRSLNMGISMPMESSWRYTGGGSGPNAGINLGLFRRQTTGDVEAYCDQGKHVCRAFGQTGCCNNDAYCIISESGEGKCCPLGTVCGEDPCQMTATLCTEVVTVTPTVTATDNIISAEVIITSTSTGCCVRACTYTMHLCDEKFGGFCCGNDAVCLPDKMCQATPNPNMPTSTVPSSTTTTTSDLCSTGSFACAEAAGGGCCPNNMICTDISSTPGCALSGSGVKTRQIFTQTEPTGSADSIVTDKPSETPSITGSAGGASSTGAGPDATDSPASSELSAGAKAGIGIGAAVGALSLIALGVFFFHRHRKNKTAAAAAALPPPPPNQPQDPQMAQYAGYPGAPGQQPQYYAGTQYPQGYYPAPQASPLMQPAHSYYDPAEAIKQQAPQEFAGDDAVNGAVMLPNTEARTIPTAELPAQ